MLTIRSNPPPIIIPMINKPGPMVCLQKKHSYTLLLMRFSRIPCSLHGTMPSIAQVDNNLFSVGSTGLFKLGREIILWLLASCNLLQYDWSRRIDSGDDWRRPIERIRYWWMGTPEETGLPPRSQESGRASSTNDVTYLPVPYRSVIT